jgi:hypothetical protein
MIGWNVIIDIVSLDQIVLQFRMVTTLLNGQKRFWIFVLWLSYRVSGQLASEWKVIIVWEKIVTASFLSRATFEGELFDGFTWFFEGFWHFTSKSNTSLLWGECKPPIQGFVWWSVRRLNSSEKVSWNLCQKNSYHLLLTFHPHFSIVIFCPLRTWRAKHVKAEELQFIGQMNVQRR